MSGIGTKFWCASREYVRICVLNGRWTFGEGGDGIPISPHRNLESLNQFSEPFKEVHNFLVEVSKRDSEKTQEWAVEVALEIWGVQVALFPEAKEQMPTKLVSPFSQTCNEQGSRNVENLSRSSQDRKWNSTGSSYLKRPKCVNFIESTQNTDWNPLTKWKFPIFK